MEKHVIFGVHVTDRMKNAVELQRAFSEFGCQIKTRLGLHEVSASACSPNGLVILEMVGDDAILDRAVERPLVRKTCGLRRPRSEGLVRGDRDHGQDRHDKKDDHELDHRETPVLVQPNPTPRTVHMNPPVRACPRHPKYS
mgnify:CR=1 FL=1